MPEGESAEQKAEDDMYASFNMTIMIERRSDGKVVKLAKVRGRNETEGTEEKKKRCTMVLAQLLTHTPHTSHTTTPRRNSNGRIATEDKMTLACPMPSQRLLACWTARESK
jgi:hypothetical protein